MNDYFNANFLCLIHWMLLHGQFLSTFDNMLMRAVRNLGSSDICED